MTVKAGNRPGDHVTGTAYGVLDAKRVAFPGVTVYSQCPTCGMERRRPLEDHHPLNYPHLNGPPEEVHFYCDRGPCNTEWNVLVIVEVKIRLATNAEVAQGHGPPAT